MGEPVISIRSGGRGITAVDIRELHTKAAALTRHSGALDDAAAACGRAKEALAQVNVSVQPTVFGAAIGSPPSAVSAPVVMPAQLARARDAAMADIAQCRSMIAAASSRFADISRRLRVAGSTYTSSDARSRDIFGRLLKGNPILGLFGTVGYGVADYFRAGVTGKGWSASRIQNSTHGVHPGLIAAWAPLVGMLNPSRPFWKAPDVGDASAVLHRLKTPPAFGTIPPPNVYQVTAKPGYRPATQTLDGAFGLVDELYGKSGNLPSSTVGIQPIEHEGQKRTWLVAIPGTHNGEKRTPFSWRSNLALMDNDMKSRYNCDATQSVLAAMKKAGIPKSDDVVLVAHSQGGMVASTVAVMGGYKVTHVATAGSPMARHRLPPGVYGTHLENRGELASDVDGAENRMNKHQVTVVRTSPTSAGGTSTSTDMHGLRTHRQTLRLARETGNADLEKNLRHLEDSLAGKAGPITYYRAQTQEATVAIPPLPGGLPIPIVRVPVRAG